MRGIFLETSSDKSFRGDKAPLAAWVYNFSLSAETTRLILPVGEMELALPARSLTKNSFSILVDGAGDVKKTAILKTGKATDESTTVIQVLDYNADSLKASFENLKPKLADLEKQFADCESAKIPTDREKINLTVIRAFIAYGLEDASRGRLPRSAYVLADLEKRISETAASLKSLLAREKTALPVMRYAGGPITLTGGHFVGDRIDENGRTSRGPVQLLGYGHFGQIKKDIPRLQDYGHNIIQQEIGPKSTVFAPRDSGNFSVDFKVLDESILPMLKNAEAAHVSVNLLLSPHYFPKWAAEKWPEVANPTSGNFLQIIPDAPEAKAVVEAHIRAVVSKVRGLPALQSLTLANEPELIDTRKSPFSQNHWKEWLEKRHGKIESLNKRWGASYKNFAEVPMQDPNRAEPTPAFYDHSVWNAERFAAWHRWMAEVVHKDAPEIPVHVKIMQNIFERSDRMGRGVDPEAFCL
ncbi:MAG: beta-galactosidase, partial [Spirochaetia bacterium]|nr:beta-galactosidase [Spirochaetia bacterium]